MGVLNTSPYAYLYGVQYVINVIGTAKYTALVSNSFVGLGPDPVCTASATTPGLLLHWHNYYTIRVASVLRDIRAPHNNTSEWNGNPSKYAAPREDTQHRRDRRESEGDRQHDG